MAKLNKQEINAIANKAMRTITMINEEARQEAIKNYEPSDKYKELKAKLERLLEINKTIHALEKEAGVLCNDVNDIKASENNWVYRGNITEERTITHYLNSLVCHEVKVKPTPTLEELKEDITIAAIDEGFNAEAFINNLVEKFK